MSDDVKLFRSPAHQVFAERERAIYEAHIARGVNAYLEAVHADRRGRWEALLAGREEAAGVRQWAADMASVHRTAPDAEPQATVEVFGNELPWVTALYVVKYGEAEDFWPAALTDDDARRAARWLAGDTPEGVTYVRSI